MNRMHFPTLGRFMSADPYKQSGRSADPQTFNRYAYSRNDPVGLSDPTGLDFISAVVGGNGGCLARKRSRQLDSGEIVTHWDFLGSCDDGIFSKGGIGDGSGGGPIESLMDAALAAFARVAQILAGGTDCASWFGKDAKAALETMKKNLKLFPKGGGPGGTDTGITQSGYPGGADVIPGGTYRTPALFVIWRDGPFFAGGKGHIDSYEHGSPMAQNAALLHELAHNIVVRDPNGQEAPQFLIPNDAGDPAASQANTKLVDQHCGDEIFNTR